jgi:glyceraldehyde 3-phosphate dehydrogenase
MITRAIFDYPVNTQVVAINASMSVDYIAYQLKYDSAHGVFGHDVSCDRDRYGNELLKVNGSKIYITHERDPAKIPWILNEVNYVVDATGSFKTISTAAAHLKSTGVIGVVITAPSDDAPMFVMGVNEQDYVPDTRVVSNASCTTNALAPIAKILHEKWGIQSGLMTTIHAATASQNVVDGKSVKDWRGGRATLTNIIPSSTGAAKAVGKVLPSLAGKLTGMSVRVPTIDVSMIDLTVNLERPATYQEICDAMRAAAEGELEGILGYTEDAAVSSDFIHDSRSAIFDATAGIQLTDKFFKLVAWYDNEWAYSKRTIELVRHMHNVTLAGMAS